MDNKGRQARARQAMSESRLDALVVTHLANIRYLCGFSGSAAALVITDPSAVLFTDGRYTQQARLEVNGAKVKIVPKSPLAGVAELLAGTAFSRRIGIEAAHMTVAERDALRKALGRRTKLVAAPGIVERLRSVKQPDEIGRIRAACHMGAELFNRLLKVIRPGIFESEIAGEIEFAARKAGAEQMSFPTLIAGGARSALPHGRASNQPLPARGFVVCDFGVILAGYCSDMTRTVHAGTPRAEARRVYDAVREAQLAALQAVKPGVTAGEVDRAARKLLYNRHLSKFFSHSTGHGVGLEIHEAPRIRAGQKEPLQAGMVITIEPGVYIPGKWGVRIEDTVVVTEAGCEILTPCPKDLITV